jgi:hypothetical protein
MPLFRSDDFKALAIAAAAMFAAATPRIASATLGEPEVTVQTDVDKARASIKSSVDRDSYRVHEITLASGTVMREFVGPDGKVFAVAWQ